MVDVAIVKRARSQPRPSSTPGVHFDVGSPAMRDLPRYEMTGRYTGPEQEDPRVRAEVVAWLARLLRKPRER